MTHAEIYAEAGQIAVVAMGIKKERDTGDSRRFTTVWAADDDPLAWVCLTECIVSLVERSHKPARRSR